MNLKFKIHKLPIKEGQVFNHRQANIPLIFKGPPDIDDYTELWFLWEEERLKTDKELINNNTVYRYKKL